MLQESTNTLPQHPGGGGGLAPVEPGDGKRRSKRFASASENLKRFLLRISNEIEHLDREKRLRLFRQQIKAHQYYDGNFYGYVDENCSWVDCKREEGEKWYSNNEYYPYIRTALMELSRRQTQVVINPATQTEKLQRVAKFAQSRYDANRDRTFTTIKQQTEDTYALLNGIVFRYTFTDFGCGRREKMPVLKKREQRGTVTQIKLCADCARPVPPDVEVNEFDETSEPCRGCGSAFAQILTDSDEPDVITGYEELRRGENQWISPNPVGIIVSMQAGRVEETPFLKWKQLILRSVLEDKFPDVDFPSTGTESIELRYIANQQVAQPSSYAEGFDNYSDGQSAQAEGKELELLEFQQIWLDYPVYAKWQSNEETVLANGKTIPAGTPLGKIFPKGLYFAKVGDVVVDMWNEDKNRKWASSPYSLRAGSMYGAGTTPAHQDQEVVNDLERLQMSSAYNNGVLREFVDDARIPELSVDPTIPTVVKNPDNQPIIGYAYAQASPSSLSSDVYGLSDKRKQEMQSKIGAFSMNGSGAADLQNVAKHATTMSIFRDMSVGRFAPDLKLMADQLDRRQAYQFLENEKDFFTPEQWREVAGDFGEETVRDFLKCDLRRDLIVTIAPGSYMPKSEAQMQAKIMSFAELAPALAQNPEWVAYGMEVFGIPEQLGGWNADRIKADQIVERFKLLAELFIEKMGDAPDSDLENPAIREVAEQIGKYSQIPVDVFLDNHAGLTEALKDWAQKDEGRNAPNVLKAAVALRIVKHQQAIKLQPALIEKLQQSALEPLLADDLAKEQEASAAEERRAAEEKQLMMLDKVADLGDRERQREHEIEKQDSELQAEKEIALLNAAAGSQAAAVGT